ncbi:PrsW family glutamic-type intramembrane protease [Gordonia polyisoprenivorans]|uniref:PrsW family glutamic-type intramembrane protease n=1 Tax=Gordonia polyisoprenivorans TaxID=84595 RepID=UPI000B99D9AB|nr:PrsW family glutamic-type intramembrane protease [Gordonia polyisoprenivorans]OZC34025.1 PrsW family intramembrane metalloprotease [Gordonia polyisoprenivorans]
MTNSLVPPPGWYPYGAASTTAHWDGMGWTGESAPDSSVSSPPAWHRRPWRFLTHQWFWWIVAGMVVAVGFGIIGNSGSGHWWVWPAAIGVVLVMTGIVTLVAPHLRFTELNRLPLTIVVGVVSGAVALGVATAVEGLLEPHLHLPFAVDLWLSGPIEETCKIAVPLILLIFARSVFGDPRRGVLMVLISGSVFGIGEAIQYMGGGNGTNSHLLQAVTRPLTEIGHPLWASIAAAAIWLAAHRSGRVITKVGFLGWLTAALLHSVHDGIGSFGQHGSKNTVTDQDFTLTDVVQEGVVLNVFSILVAVVSYLVLRHVLRELVPPTAIATNAPRWRPRLVQWGVPEAQVAPVKSAAAGSGFEGHR